MIQKHGSARWQGGLRDGKGQVSTETGVLSNEDYSFAKRFGDQPGTNPEELIGAAHASCFSMALAAALEKAGVTAENIESTSTVSLEQKGPGFEITRVHLDVVATIPGASADQFREIAEDAKANCPVSKVLAGADITMSARLAE
ncbi:OsmC family protein [Rubellimicrobium arenae]|uniref:OsmC family protein n=1 Tax=Rubellimicrobium arenae TaxID=2817372 RepID=UPI001B30F60F|nr:OsmC family protein [Rubellimicrobium arenae]